MGSMKWFLSLVLVVVCAALALADSDQGWDEEETGFPGDHENAGYDSDQGWDEEETGFPGDHENAAYAPPNPGRCPNAKDAIGVCISECKYDSDCSYPRKCCFNGCG